MARDNVYSSSKGIQLFAYAVNTNADTAIVSSIIDTQGFDEAICFIHTHTLSDVDATFAVLVEDGDNSGLSDNGAVPDDNLLGTESGAAFTFASDNKIIKIGYKPRKRYLRVTVTPTGNNSGNAPITGMALLCSPRTGALTTQIN